MRVYDDAQPKVILKPGDTVHGTLTAGIGHTGGLRIGMAVTPELVDYWEEMDLEVAAGRLVDKVGATCVLRMTTHWYSALLSFVFNLGAPDSNIWSVIKAEKWDAVGPYMMRFDRGEVNGQPVVIPGLLHRRMAEVALGTTPDSAAAAPAPSMDNLQPAPVDTTAGPLAIIGAAVDIAPSSSVTRAMPTPPAEMAMKPLAQSKSFMAQVTTLGVGAMALVAPIIHQLGSGIESVSDAIKPYVDGSPAVAQVETYLVVIMATCAGAGVIFTWAKNRNMREG